MVIEVKPDPADGLPACKAGEWALEKHQLLQQYVHTCRGTRRMFLQGDPSSSYGPGGATYIELFSGPGRLFNDRVEFFDGSPIVSHREAMKSKTVFSAMHLGDERSDFCAAVCTRLEREGAYPIPYEMTAERSAEAIIAKLNPYGFNFAFLDPFGFDGLPFSVIETFARFRRMDVLIHVSAMELQRKLPDYMQSEHCTLDRFAPGWREVVKGRAPDVQSRGKILEHWVSLIRDAGFIEARGMPLIRGPDNQALYWLVLIAKHELATKFWNAISKSSSYELF